MILQIPIALSWIRAIGRTRAHLPIFALLCVLAGLLVPGIASASTDALPE